MRAHVLAIASRWVSVCLLVAVSASNVGCVIYIDEDTPEFDDARVVKHRPDARAEQSIDAEVWLDGTNFDDARAQNQIDAGIIAPPVDALNVPTTFDAAIDAQNDATFDAQIDATFDASESAPIDASSVDAASSIDAYLADAQNDSAQDASTCNDDGRCDYGETGASCPSDCIINSTVGVIDCSTLHAECDWCATLPWEQQDECNTSQGLYLGCLSCGYGV